MLAPDRDKIGTDLGCQPASSGRVAQCPGCWPKRLAWHSPCVHSRRAKWKKKTPETLFQAHGIQWPVDVEPLCVIACRLFGVVVKQGSQWLGAAGQGELCHPMTPHFRGLR